MDRQTDKVITIRSPQTSSGKALIKLFKNEL